MITTMSSRSPGFKPALAAADQRLGRRSLKALCRGADLLVPRPFDIDTAQHRAEAGNALRGAIGQPACDNVLVHRALRRCGGRLGVATGGKAQHIAAAIAGER